MTLFPYNTTTEKMRSQQFQIYYLISSIRSLFHKQKIHELPHSLQATGPRVGMKTNGKTFLYGGVTYNVQILRWYSKNYIINLLISYFSIFKGLYLSSRNISHNCTSCCLETNFQFWNTKLWFFLSHKYRTRSLTIYNYKSSKLH
jgi:hypothetical protein